MGKCGGQRVWGCGGARKEEGPGRGRGGDCGVATFLVPCCRRPGQPLILVWRRGELPPHPRILLISAALAAAVPQVPQGRAQAVRRVFEPVDVRARAGGGRRYHVAYAHRPERPQAGLDGSHESVEEGVCGWWMWVGVGWWMSVVRGRRWCSIGWLRRHGDLLPSARTFVRSCICLARSTTRSSVSSRSARPRRSAAPGSSSCCRLSARTRAMRGARS